MSQIDPTIQQEATDFANGLPEDQLVPQLHQLKLDYQALLPPDPNKDARDLVALKMQAIHFRLERI
jgi:hypothetical protein